MTVAVLDIGKTNVKVALFDDQFRLLAEKSQPNLSRPAPPYRHYDIDAIWRFLFDTLSEFSREYAIDCIVPTTHGATAAVVGDDPDRDDGLVLPILDYEDTVVDAVEPDYARIRPPFRLTFSPTLGAGLNFGRQLAYLQRAYPDGFARARAVLSYPQYWSWRLSGTMTSGVTSLGNHSDLWEPVKARYSSVVDALQLRPLLPPLASAHEAVGTLRPALAARAGLSPATRVLSGIHDSNASLLPHLLARAKPFTVVSTGTWVILMAVGTALDRLDADAGMLANVAADGAPVACGMFMGGREFAHLTEGASTRALPDDLEEVVASGAMALPSFTNESGPFRRHIGAIVGSVPDRPGARASLATLYTALVTDALLSRLGADAGPLVVDGGFVKSPAFAGVLAALRPRQSVHVAEASAGAARGAALLATWPKPPPDQSQNMAPMAVPGLDAYADRWREAVRKL